MIKNITLFILCVLSIKGFGQELKSTNGSDHKIFKEGSIFEMVIDTEERDEFNDDQCCRDHITLLGTINSIAKDSINLKLYKWSSKRTIENTELYNIYDFKNSATSMSIAHQDK